MVPVTPYVHRSRRLATASVLLPLLALGLACDGPVPGERPEERAEVGSHLAPLADANLYDSFSRVDSTTSLGSLEAGGQAWSVTPTIAKWGISGGKAYLATDDGTWGDHYATVNAAANVRVMVTLSTLGQFSGLTFRFIDRSNCWKLATDLGAGKYMLTKFVNGTQTFPLSIAQAPVAGDVLEVRTSGDRIDVYINGVLKGGVNDASHQSATRVGLLGSLDNLARYDEFKAYYIDSNLYDSFSRADNTTSLGSLEAGGQAWSVTPTVAKWGISAGKAYLATDDGTWGDHYATVNAAANVRVMVTLSTLGQFSGLTFRFIDRSNCWKLATDTGAGKYFLTKFVNGTQTFPLSIAQAPVAGDVLEVRASGDRIDVYINGVLKGGVNDVSHLSATRVGLLGSADNLARYDEFKVYTSSTSTGTRSATLHPFRSDSVWNLPIGTGATFADTTDLATRDFIATSINGTSIRTWANWDHYSHPISFASSSDPWATVTDYNDASRSASYYIPATAPIASGTDEHMHIINPARTFIDEAWNVTRQSTTAYRVGRHHKIDLYGSGLGPQNGVRAYGGSAIGGLIRAWEADPNHPKYTGKIQHALAVAIDRIQLYYSGGTSGYDANGYGTARGYVWPATEQDWNSETTYKGHVPMGAYFAIPPSVDINSLGLSPQGKMVAQALQDFGAYVTDAASSAVIFYVEPTAPSAFVTAIRNDLPLIRSKMRRVTNNSPSTPNGPGPRRVPMLPDLAPPP